MKPAFALIGAAALGAALFLAGYAAALLDGRPRRPTTDELMAMSDTDFTAWQKKVGLKTLSDFPQYRSESLRWSDTGEAVETYQTFNYPTGTWYTFTGTLQNGKPVTLRSVG